MKKKLFFLIFAGIFSLFAFSSALSQEENILSFHSDIIVHPDSSMTVCETIKVRAEGDQIKRGIYRDFPTNYKDSYGNNYKVGFEVVSAQRDNQPVNYWIENLSNGKRVNMGKKDLS